MKSLFQKITLLLASLLLLNFTACSRKTAEASGNNGDVKIMATFYPLYIMLLNITDGADGIELSMLAPADTGCLHDYQLTTRDMKNLESCSILVMNGAGMEDFTDKAFETKDKSCIINASEGFPLTEDNAHVWVSVSGCIYEVERITEGLCTLDEKNAAVYRKNCAEYVSRIQETGNWMHSKLDRFAGTSIITFHEAFPYFASEFNLKIAASIEREAGTEPNAKELNQLINTIKSVQASGGRTALFAEPQYSSSAASVIAAETGLEVGELDPSVSGKLYKDAWIDAMKNNAEVLERLLGQEK